MKFSSKISRIITCNGGCGDSTFFMLENGDVYACGRNDSGQLGLNDTTNRNIPTKITVINNIKDIICGDDYTFFVLNDGTIYCCGNNYWGSLGMGDIKNRTTLTLFTALSNIKLIACGNAHTLFLLNDGSVYGCGFNSSGQLGLGNITNPIMTPTKLNNVNITNVQNIMCGGGITLFILENNVIYGSGSNTFGQLGLSSSVVYEKAPVVVGNSNVKDIICGGEHTFNIMNDGTIYCCGYNGTGALGTGTNPNIQVNPFTVLKNINNVKSIECGSEYTLFILNDGTVYGTGCNSYGSLGMGDLTNRFTPTKITRISNVKSVVCGNHHTFFILNNDSIYACGDNQYGQLGLGNNDSITVPTLMSEQSSSSYSRLLSILSNNFTMYESQSDVGYPCLIYNLDNKNLYIKLDEVKDSNSSNVKVNSTNKSFFIDKNI